MEKRRFILCSLALPSTLLSFSFSLFLLSISLPPPLLIPRAPPFTMSSFAATRAIPSGIASTPAVSARAVAARAAPKPER